MDRTLFQNHHLERFVDAQADTYGTALAEIRSGKKQSHWMWFIFPQLLGLGKSEYARIYGIRDRNEAEAYLQHPLLGPRLHEICLALLELDGSDALAIFGSPDNLKLQSAMTLFLSVPSNYFDVFQQVLDKFFSGVMDEKTIDILDSDLSAG